MATIFQNTIDKLTEVEKLIQRLLDQNNIPTSARQAVAGLGVLSTATYLVSRYIIYRLYLDPVSRIPGPPVSRWVPFSGNFIEIFREDAAEPHKKWAQKYGGILRYHTTWNQSRVLVSDPVLLKQVLTVQQYDFIKTPEASKFLAKFLGNGLLVAEGDVHRHQRKMLNPAFSVHTLRDLVPMLTVPAVQLARLWKAERDYDAPLDVANDLSLTTLDVIGLAGFGHPFHALEGHGEDKLSRAYLSIFGSNDNRSIMRFLAMFFPILQHIPTKRNRELRQALRWLTEGSREVVEACVERTAEQKKQGIRPNNILALMIDSSEGNMSVEEMRHQCLTFLAAGHETTSVSLSWCLWLLARDPAVQKQLRDEVVPVFGPVQHDHSLFHSQDPLQVDADGAQIPTYETINALPVLNNVCKETLRLIPPVPTTSRIAEKDVVLGPYHIPKGTRIFIPPMVMHHDKTIWGEDAEDFRPSRWTEEAAQAAGPYEYMPFLAGGRQCIGNRFAMLEMKIFLAVLITQFEFLEAPDYTPGKRQAITLRPHPNMTLIVRPIH